MADNLPVRDSSAPRRGLPAPEAQPAPRKGGKRLGAGRKPKLGDVRQSCIYLRPSETATIDRAAAACRENRTAFLRRALAKAGEAWDRGERLLSSAAGPGRNRAVRPGDERATKQIALYLPLFFASLADRLVAEGMAPNRCALIRDVGLALATSVPAVPGKP